MINIFSAVFQVSFFDLLHICLFFLKEFRFFLRWELFFCSIERDEFLFWRVDFFLLLRSFVFCFVFRRKRIVFFLLPWESWVLFFFLRVLRFLYGASLFFFWSFERVGFFLPLSGWSLFSWESWDVFCFLFGESWVFFPCENLFFVQGEREKRESWALILRGFIVLVERESWVFLPLSGRSFFSWENWVFFLARFFLLRQRKSWVLSVRVSSFLFSQNRLFVRESFYLVWETGVFFFSLQGELRKLRWVFVLFGWFFSLLCELVFFFSF